MLINMRQCSLFAIGVSLLFAASCSMQSVTQEASDRIEGTAKVTEDLAEKAMLPDIPENIDTVRTKSEIWLGSSSTKISDGEPLPARFETENAVTFVTNQELGLFDLAKKITELTGLLVRVDDMLLSGNSNGANDTISLNYHGKLSGLLDQISTRFGLYWKYKRGVLSFYEMETRSYTIYALPVESTISTDISNDGGSTSGGETMGTSSSDISNNVTLEMWNQIEDTINNMLPSAASMSISSTSGTITVTAPPETLVKIGKYVRELNEKLARQVAITVRVLQVNLKDEHQYGLDLSATLGKLGSFTSGTFTGASTVAKGALGSLGGGLTFANGKVKVSAIIQALATQGQVSTVTTATVTTMNNKAAPVQVSKTQDYVSKFTTTTSGSTSDTVSYTTETSTVNTGFTMNILPRILDHGRLMLMFSVNLSTLENMENYELPKSKDSEGNESGGGTMQLPTTASKSFTQEMIMKSGSTLVVTGFEDVNDDLQKKGIDDADFMLLGGSKDIKKNRTVLVIVMTPEVLISPLSPETRVND